MTYMWGREVADEIEQHGSEWRNGTVVLEGDEAVAALWAALMLHYGVQHRVGD